jgi:carnitine O-acetyltransferase
MVARTFTRPSSLDDTLNGTFATVPMSDPPAMADSKSDPNGSLPVRSEASAKESAQSFSAEAKEPLAHSTNPNSRRGITFAHQDKLPKLPIPDLDASCQKYLAALKPLQSDKEHNDTAISVQEFLKGDGAVLQEKLKKYASARANYIEQFCTFATHFAATTLTSQGTTRTSTLTTPSSSTSTRSSCSKMTPPRPATTKSPARHH